MIKITIDRIEGEVAVLEIGEQFIDVPVGALPEGAGEGARLQLVLSSSGDEEDARARAEARLERLKARDTGGDVFDL